MRGLIVKGGGHAMAAGITVERDKLGELRAFFEERAAADVFRLQDEESLPIDGALAAEGATHGLLDALEKAGPFGAGHVAPVFVLPRHRLADARPVGTNHIRADLQSDGGGRIQAIAFRAVDTALGRIPVQEPRQHGPCRRLAVGQLLERQPHACNSASSMRRWPDQARTVCSRVSSPICACVAS